MNSLQERQGSADENAVELALVTGSVVAVVAVIVASLTLKAAVTARIERKRWTRR